MGLVIAFVIVAALGFGAGRVKHPANLKISAVKAELAKLEAEGKAEYAAVVARLKSLL